MAPLAVKAMVVIRRPDDSLLVSSDQDKSGVKFERPLGGGVEFGERAADAARREIREEIGQELRNVRLLDIVENIFQLDGNDGHEIVFLFEAEFVDPKAYEIDEQVNRDDPSGGPCVHWRPVRDSRCRLVPDGIEHLIWP